MSSKKDKIKKIPDVEAEAKANRQAYFKEAKEYKQRIKPLVNFLRSKKLRFSHAMVGQVRIQYFRLDQYQKMLQDNRSYIQQNQQLGKLAKNSSSDFIYYKRPEDIKIKYPKRLEPVLQDNANKKYASFRFDTTESKKGTTIFMVLAVLMLVMFPIWPYELKYGIWLVTLILTLLISAMILLRLVVFLLCSIFNYQVWIFPNFFQTNGFFDGFIPWYQVTKGDKSWLNIFIRVFAISSFMLLALHVYLNPTFIDENIQFTKITINDMHDWGVEKIINKGNFSQRAITNLEVILNETADVQDEYNSSSNQQTGTQQIDPNPQHKSAQQQQIEAVPYSQFQEDAAEQSKHQL